MNAIIRQQQKQLVAIQAQIQALLTDRVVTKGKEEGATKVAKPQIFDGILSKVSEFISACRLYIRMRMRETAVKEQIQWILLYIQRGLVDIWKENILEDLEAVKVEYESTGEFLSEIKKEFRGGDKESVKIVELKRLEQWSKLIEEFVQDFKRIARSSNYKGCPLIEEFKKGINGAIQRKLMEMENQPSFIKQWFKRAITLNRN